MAHWRLGEKDEARKALARADGHFQSWCHERPDGRGTAWVTWWHDGPRLVALRREAHALIDGHVPDDTAALAAVRADMGNLIDDRDSPTWAYDLALRLEPGNAGYRGALAVRLIELGRPAEAEPLLAAMVEGKTDAPRNGSIGARCSPTRICRTAPRPTSRVRSSGCPKTSNSGDRGPRPAR